MTAVVETRGGRVLVDDDDLPTVEPYKWYVRRSGHTAYALTNVRTPEGRQTTLLMHRLLLDVGPGWHVDHANGDGLDNRRANIRPASSSQNQANQHALTRNTSGFRGVDFRDGRWRARITIGYRSVNLGRFDSAEDAARAYEAAARRHFGEFVGTTRLDRSIEVSQRYMAAREGPRRAPVGTPHCPKGHPYDEENTYVCCRPDGRVSRTCRACNREAAARLAARRREGRSA